MRNWWPILIPAVLAACQPAVPDSAAGVGFQDYDDYIQEQQARDAALETGGPLVPAGADAPLTVIETPGPTDPTQVAGGADDAETVAADARELLQRPAGISDEQDFTAVSERQSIESDRQRLAAQREQFQVIAPTAVPNRPSNLGANVAAYAVATSHPIGTKVYDRSATASSARAARACQRYSSPNAAQQAFLEAGGPDRDRLGVDPDGDGYACGWDPRPFRSAVRN